MSSPIKSKLLEAFKNPNRHIVRQDLVEQMHELIKDEQVEPWFARPHPALDGKSPNQVIQEGNIQVIQDFILDMASGSPS